MIAKTFTIGKEDFSNWVKANKDVEDLTLTGTLAYGKYGNFGDFEEELFSLNLKVLRLVDFHIPDHQYYDKTTISFEEYFFNVHDDCCLKFSKLQKIAINSDKVHNFIFNDGWIFSEDKKTLIHAPETITEYIHPDGVTCIGKAAFFEYEDLKTVTFNDSLIEIDNYAFADCESLNKVILPNSVIKLGEYAFAGAYIEDLTLSKHLQEIPDDCFKYTDLSEIKIPNSVKRIGAEAFQCAQIKKIIIPQGVEIIEFDAFDRLEYISLPSTLKEIAPDFYYEECCDVGDHPPYVEVHPDNPIFYAENGTLYFKETGKQVLDAPYNEEDNYHHEDGDCEHCCHHCPTTEEATRALEDLRPKAEAGDAEAQNSLGIILYYGDKWIEPNYEEGLEWIKKSATQGYVPAMMDLADIYHEGRNMEVDYNECFRLLLMAAEQGDERGMNNLAACYEEGHGTPKDLQRALSWYKKALDNGYFKAHEDIKRIEQQLNK